MTAFHQLLDEYDRGVIGRRALCASLLTLVARQSSAATQAASAAVRAASVNHLQFGVTDLARSREFYSALLGATVRDQTDAVWTLTIPGTGTWLSLNKVAAPRAGLLDHVGIGITAFNHDRAAADVTRVLPAAKVQQMANKRSLFVDDPDGVRIQLIDGSDDGGLGSPPSKR